MRINVAIPENQVEPGVINAALEATTRLDENLIKSGAVPIFKDAKDAVRWKPEPPGDEHFDHAAMVLKRGWGDCDDLAPWHAASLRATGKDRGAKAIVKQSGPKRWHALVQRSDGSIEDPSRAAGMRGPGSAEISGLAPMTELSSVVGTYFANRPQLAVRPVFDSAGQLESWQTRTDLPWHWMPGKTKTDIAMVSLHKAPSASQSIVGSLRGAAQLGMVDDPINYEHRDRIAAVEAAVCGMPHEDMVEIFGYDETEAAEAIVGSLFKSIAHIASKAVKTAVKVTTAPLKVGVSIIKSPIAQSIAKAIPGIGTGVAAGMAAASYGFKLLDKATGKPKTVTPEQALDMHLKGEPLHMVHPETGQQVKINPPTPGQPPLKPVTDQEWSKRVPIHPSALPTQFTIHCTPIPG